MFGFGAEAAQAAKVAAAGGFGAGVMLYIKHPGTLLRASLGVVVGVGIASIFAQSVSVWFGWGEVQVAAMLGLLGKGAATGLLNAIDRIDFERFFLKG
jgi:hypothetical protein